MSDRNLLLARPELARGRMLEGRRVLDLAQGILIALRRYRADTAFEELIAVAHKHDVSVSALAAALVMLATATEDSSAPHPEALVVARRAWGDVLDVRSP